MSSDFSDGQRNNEYPKTSAVADQGAIVDNSDVYHTTLGGHLKIEKPHNFDNAFRGTTGSAYGVVTALYNVIWSYIGYSNANYAMSEIKNPVRTLRIAALIAIAIVGVLYMLANIAYFAVVPREEIISSGRILAGSFFRNVFGPKAERALSVFVALSAFGNVLSVIFSQGRLVQELGREGVLPFSKLWASNKPLDAPFMGLFEHWLVSVIIMLAPPPGDAYNFILNVISYPLSIFNIFVALGLVYLYFNRSTGQKWKDKREVFHRDFLDQALPYIGEDLILAVHSVYSPNLRLRQGNFDDQSMRIQLFPSWQYFVEMKEDKENLLRLS
ncbi:MAG: hypothetical protein Q9157_003293 [Trypethelium eluteriae]